jgi:hypothetical protein
VKKVAAIIPAFNEESTIGQVVRILKSSPCLHEVLVISDGSTDQTAQFAREAGAVVHEIFPNRGKGEAMRYGVCQTDAEVIVFFDADLFHLTFQHVEALVSPVVDGTSVMQSGLRDRGFVLTALTKHLPLISGQRAMRRFVMEGVPARYLKGFMVEVALNYYCRSRKLRTGVVKLTGLAIRRKDQKVGLPRAVLQYIHMDAQIVKAMVVVRVARLFGKF